MVESRGDISGLGVGSRITIGGWEFRFQIGASFASAQCSTIPSPNCDIPSIVLDACLPTGLRIARPELTRTARAESIEDARVVEKFCFLKVRELIQQSKYYAISPDT